MANIVFEIIDDEPQTCVVCFQNSSKTLTCNNDKCLQVICPDCMNMYLDMCAESNKLVACPQQGCTGYYDHSSMMGFSDLRNKLDMIVSRYYRETKGRAVQDKLQERKIATELVERRTQFFLSKMPKSVLRVTQIIDPLRGAKVQKTQEFAQQKVKRLNFRPCMHAFCTGRMNEALLCDTCDTTFCEDCEEVKKSGHVCNPEIKANVEYKRGLGKCPGCGFAVEHGDGCMAMTCPKCHTNYWYNTGESSGGHGSHNEPVEFNTKTSIISSYRIAPELITRVRAIETATRKAPSLDAALEALCTCPEITPEIANVFGKAHATYSRGIARRAQAVRILIAIEDVFKKGDDVDARVKRLVNSF